MKTAALRFFEVCVRLQLALWIYAIACACVSTVGGDEFNYDNTSTL